MKRYKIRLGWIGCGFIGQLAHLENFSSLSDVEITALADTKIKLAKKVAKKYGIKKIYNNHLDLLKNEKKLDAIIVVTKRFQTQFIVKDILKKKINVFTEKPVSISNKYFLKLLDLSKKNNLNCIIGYMKRHDAGIKLGKKIFIQILKNKSLGKFISYNLTCLAGSNYAGISGEIKTNEKSKKINLLKTYKNISPNWISKKNILKYEKFLNFYIHDINIINYFFEDIYKINSTQLSSSGGNITFKHKDFIGTFNYNYIDSDYWEEKLEFFFSNGKLIIDMPPAFKKNISAKVSVLNYNTNKIKYYNTKNSWSFYNQSKDFIEILKNNKKSTCDITNSTRDMRIIEEIWKKHLKIDSR